MNVPPPAMLDNWENRIPVPKNQTTGKGFTSVTHFFFQIEKLNPKVDWCPPTLSSPSHPTHLLMDTRRASSYTGQCVSSSCSA